MSEADTVGKAKPEVTGKQATKSGNQVRLFGRGIVRPLDPDDPCSLDHPSHDEDWLALARALGRAMADFDWDRINGSDNKGPK
jgi:hypothetical protein